MVICPNSLMSHHVLRISTLLFGVTLSRDQVKTAFYGSQQMDWGASDMSHMWTVEVESEKWPGMADIRFRDVQTVSQFGTLPFMARNK